MQALQISRALDPSERFFWLLDKISGMNFVVFAEINGVIDSEHLRAALDQAQRAYPLLRVCIHHTPDAADALRFEPAQAAIQLQQIDVRTDNWQAPLEQALAEPFELEQAPLMRCQHLHFSDQPRSVLALTFHHAVADGRSGTALLRALLHYLAAPQASHHFTETTVPAPLHQTFPPEYDWARRPDAALALAALRKSETKRYGRSSPLPWLDSQQSQRTPRFKRIVLDAHTTARLIKQCRQHGATIHGALGAAQLQATHQSTGAPEALTLNLGSPADMRGYLDRPISTDGLGLYVTLLFSNYQMGDADAFWPLAREVGADIKRQLGRGDGHLFFSQVNPEAIPPSAAGLAAFGNAMLASPHSSMISNIGKVDAVDAALAVEAISFALCPMPYQLLFTAVSTYAGQLIMNMAYDAAKLSDARAAQLANWIETGLQQATHAAD